MPPRGWKKPSERLASSKPPSVPSAPVEQPAIREGLSEADMRFAVVAHRGASPLDSLLINYAMAASVQTGDVLKQTLADIRQLVERLENAS